MDLEKSSTLFDASARLESAADALRSMAGEKSQPIDREALTWAGKFLAEVDWDSSVHTESGHLTVQATRVRPTFYATILKVRSQLENEGFRSQDELHTFLDGVYRLLQSGGRETLENRRVVLAASLLHKLAQGILAELTRPSLSRPSTMSK